ncbi:hypothetical protein [Loktanella sp. S4079]|uniref:hypothetical protein n=1 Tax=Loktanella sp. S4079 TaxID=579483 RepID=UPI000AD038D9|nr:hypothetical protein [Loktanella sp. S4079]
MDFAFEIAGFRCEANSMRMRGRTLEASFANDAAGPLSDAFSNNTTVSFLGASALASNYAIEAINTDAANGCTAIFGALSAA